MLSTTEDLLSSAIFEDRRYEKLAALFEPLSGASLDVLASGQSLERHARGLCSGSAAERFRWLCTEKRTKPSAFRGIGRLARSLRQPWPSISAT